MLTKKLACPSCGAGLKVADTLPEGKRIKCPKCGVGFPVPGGNDEPPAPKAVAPRPRKAPSPEEDEEEELQERPVVHKKLRRKKKRPSNTPLILGLIGVLVLLVGGGVTLAVVFWPFGKNAQAIGENNPSRTGPAPAGRSGSVEPGPADGGSQQFAAGRKVLETKKSARCHTIGGAGGSPGGFGGPPGGFGGPRGGGPGMARTRGPDLGAVGKDPSHTVDWLMEQIRNPKSHKADARMPAFDGIKDDDLRALAEYLASLK